jgi:hypothetical protein
MLGRRQTLLYTLHTQVLCGEQCTYLRFHALSLKQNVRSAIYILVLLRDLQNYFLTCEYFLYLCFFVFFLAVRLVPISKWIQHVGADLGHSLPLSLCLRDRSIEKTGHICPDCDPIV